MEGSVGEVTVGTINHKENGVHVLILIQVGEPERLLRQEFSCM